MNGFLKRNTQDITPEDVYIDRDRRDASFLSGSSITPTISIAGILVLVFIVGLWGYTFRMQVLHSQSQDQGVNSAKTYIQPRRGNIFDVNGTLLADTSSTYDVVILPDQLPSDTERVFRTLAETLDISVEEIPEKIAAREGTDPIILAREVEREVAITLQTQEISGVVLKKREIRSYRYPRVFGHIIGYTGQISDREQYKEYLLNETVGKQGLEKVYEQNLHGEYGVRSPLNPEEIRKSPQPGNSLRLTVDAEFQKATHTKLKEIVDQNDKISEGVAVAMNPQTGEVLSLVSIPSYNAQMFIGGISGEEYQDLQTAEGKPLLNKAIAGEYAPGSTVKPLLAGAMLEEGVITPETEIYDPDGRLVVPNPYNPGNPAIFPDWKPHGRSDVYKAIAKSVNTFFYIYGGGTREKEGLGIERVVKWYRAFGFGSPTGVDLSGERGGTLPYTNLSADEKKKWTRGRTYNVSIGQGTLTVTPLQITTYISAIANGGTLYEPRVVDSIHNFENTETKRDLSSKVKADGLFSPKNIQVVKDGMRQTVTDGTGDELQDLPFKAAAKSGTAQTSKERNNSWFTAYAPADNPQLAVTVLVPEGDDSGETAVPVTKHMLKWYYENRGFE